MQGPSCAGVVGREHAIIAANLLDYCETHNCGDKPAAIVIAMSRFGTPFAMTLCRACVGETMAYALVEEGLEDEVLLLRPHDPSRN